MKYYFSSVSHDIQLLEASTHAYGPTSIGVDGCRHTFLEKTPFNDEQYDQLIRAAIEDHLKNCVNCRYDNEITQGVPGR